MEMVIEEGMIAPLLDRFYERVRADPEIGPVFNNAVHDWPAHLERLSDFWSSVMLTTGRYKGNPVAVHMKHAGQLTPAMFGRWLELWRETTEALLTAPGARAMQAKAAKIAESLQLSLQLSTPEGRRAMFEPKASSTPYRSTPVFTADTLPAALRRAHNTKAGTWGIIRILEGQLLYVIEESGEEKILDPAHPGLVLPQQLHHVAPVGTMRMQVDFYDHEPMIA
jgi:hemoglobin